MQFERGTKRQRDCKNGNCIWNYKYETQICQLSTATLSWSYVGNAFHPPRLPGWGTLAIYMSVVYISLTKRADNAKDYSRDAPVSDSRMSWANLALACMGHKYHVLSFGNYINEIIMNYDMFFIFSIWVEVKEEILKIFLMTMNKLLTSYWVLYMFYKLLRCLINIYIRSYKWNIPIYIYKLCKIISSI